MEKLTLASGKAVFKVEGSNCDCKPGGISPLVEILGELAQLAGLDLLRLDIAFLEKTAGQHEVVAPGFQFLSQDFQPAIGQAPRTVKKAHQVIKPLRISAHGTVQIEPERLGVFDPMPEVVAFTILFSENGNSFFSKIGSDAIAVKTLLENHETELNVRHYPLVQAFRHFHLLR
ncbi:MAG: hypothetical protein LAP85_01550 [Acidobacteriia bacterium]|nr:hypothetical protein [Terriglobia bacterium]